jgi:hypothetical protein
MRLFYTTASQLQQVPPPELLSRLDATADPYPTEKIQPAGSAGSGSTISQQDANQWQCWQRCQN